MIILFFKTEMTPIKFIFFRDGKGRRKGEKHQCVDASHMPPTRDLRRNPDMCPDWKLNWQPFGLQSSPQSTEPHQLGLNIFFK